MAKKLWLILYYLGLGAAIGGIIFLLVFGVLAIIARAIPGDDWWPVWMSLGVVGMALFVPGTILAALVQIPLRHSDNKKLLVV